MLQGQVRRRLVDGHRSAGDVKGTGNVPEALDAAIMLLVMEPVGQREERPIALGHEAYADKMVKYGVKAGRRGAILKAARPRSVPDLQGQQRGQPVRNGKPAMVDGPFAEPG